MKKYIFPALAIAAMMVSCNNAAPKMDEQPAAADAQTTGMKIAYVEVDSLMTQYTFAKDYSVTLEKKSNNARNTLTQKGNQLQAAVNNFQQKLNNNGFQSREQAASVQNAIQRQQNDLQTLQARPATPWPSSAALWRIPRHWLRGSRPTNPWPSAPFITSSTCTRPM